MSHDFSFVNCKNLPEIDVNDPEFVNTVIILLKLKKIVKKFGGLIVLKKAINLATPGKQMTNASKFQSRNVLYQAWEVQVSKQDQL